MTIKELIAKLEKLPADLLVEIYIPSNLDEDEAFVEPTIFVHNDLTSVVLAENKPVDCLDLTFFE